MNSGRSVCESMAGGQGIRRLDAMYVALAEALDAPIVTCDAPLARAPGHRAQIEVIE